MSLRVTKPIFLAFILLGHSLNQSHFHLSTQVINWAILLLICSLDEILS